MKPKAKTKSNLFVMSLTVTISMILPSISPKADHLSREQCYAYFQCVLGEESALNNCYDNTYLKKHSLTRVICMKMAQHNCKVKTGMQGTGRKMTITRPIDFFHRPIIMDKEAGEEMAQEQDIRIYNYAGWNHCPIRYQGLQDFWCDPHQLRYPPAAWCDVIPTYNVDINNVPGIPSDVKKKLLSSDKKDDVLRQKYFIYDNIYDGAKQNVTSDKE